MRFAWLFHQLVLQHAVTYQPPLKPDGFRTRDGMPMISRIAHATSQRCG